MTLRIMGVNVIALIMLLFGILYLGEYHKSLIEARLQTFKAELELVTAAISQGSLKQEKTGNTVFSNAIVTLDDLAGKQMVKSLGQKMDNRLAQRIRLFDQNGDLIADSRRIEGPNGAIITVPLEPFQTKTLQSVQLLKDMTSLVLSILPQKKTLPLYPQTTTSHAQSLPDAGAALKGRLQLSAWLNERGDIVLSAASPIIKGGQIHGVVLLTRTGQDIEDDLAHVWFNIILIFSGTLVITILLSIYLTGQIEAPLRKLAKVSEAVSHGNAGPDDIPDLSKRNDEIGRLSLVLKDMTQTMHDRLDMMEQFAADVSHELKNPLTSLKSAVETAAIVKKKEDRERLNEIIKHDIHRMDRLITDIAHASRLDTELARESFERVDIRTLMMGLIDTYKDPLERQNEDENSYEIKTKYEGTMIRLNFISSQSMHVIGNGQRLLQVIQNLLSNALSFTPKNKRVSINVIPVGKHVHMIVEDEGPGIPSNKLDEIFERFYSERPHHESYGHHSGLGLSICKQIIDAHNGTITAENITDTESKVLGARFTIILEMV